MANKMAALVALLGLIVLLSTWLSRLASMQPVAPMEHILVYTMLVMLGYFFVGVFVAKLGISLIQETIADRRTREEERRDRARARYDQLVAGENAEMGTDLVDKKSA